MGAFDDIPISWAGTEYVLRSNRVMGAIARIEDVITLPELARYGQRGTAPFGKLSMAYAALLRYVGASVTDEEVYAGMFGRGSDVTGKQVLAFIQNLMVLMTPPPTQKLPGGGSIPRGNAEPTAPASLKRPSNSRSGRGKSRRKSSGR